ncbi:TPA: hypothetical protein JS360_004132 [Escherichia coli]|nr:hypothetical protein [Escherichia coli]
MASVLDQPFTTSSAFHALAAQMIKMVNVLAISMSPFTVQYYQMWRLPKRLRFSDSINDVSCSIRIRIRIEQDSESHRADRQGQVSLQQDVASEQSYHI